ncbi:MAG: TonB-dependent receptor [Vicinamibacterales bacterium]
MLRCPAGWLACTTTLVLSVVVFPASAQTTGSQAQADPAQPSGVPQYQDAVEVVGVTPIHGLGLARDRVPANVQTTSAIELERHRGASFGEVLASGFSSVHLNETQANPFQPDVQFRGFAASPLLGLPQGLAVYQDGVRINEPFGDTVNWDILPDVAIASINLMPGSNPLFGLNALGGAISVQTKSGFTHPGHSVTLSGGSFGRVWTEIQSGAHRGAFSYYVASRLLAEDGWRDFSESRLRQLFGSAGWRSGPSALTVSMTAGSNRLIGNGPAPTGLLDEDRSAIFTHPDRTETSLGMLTLTGRRAGSERLAFDGLLYYRPATIRTLNGDDSPYEACEGEFEAFLCVEDEDEPIEDQFGNPVAAGDDPFDGTRNTSSTRSRGWGAALQATLSTPVLRRENMLIAGGSFDGGRSRYAAQTELARLTETRGAEGAGLFDADAAVGLRTAVRHMGLYATDFWTVTPRTTAMASARLTHSRIELRDQLGDELNGDHSFTRLNPAAGLTFALTPGATAYGSVSASSRVPAPSELSCADPEDPCRLPNAFVADPPLEQVIARTIEGGMRGLAPRDVRWNASFFDTRSSDDIIFISSGALTNQGHFENVGDTARRGLELAASGRLHGWMDWAGSYTFLRATFESPLALSSPNHPDAIDGEIVVAPGSAIPGVPRHQFRTELGATFDRIAVNASLAAASSQFLRGDEANTLEPLDGFAVVNLTGRAILTSKVAILARVVNLFDSRYSTFGLLGEADDVLGDEFEEPEFLSPGAPRAAWVGLQVTLP